MQHHLRATEQNGYNQAGGGERGEYLKYVEFNVFTTCEIGTCACIFKVNGVPVQLKPCRGVCESAHPVNVEASATCLSQNSSTLATILGHNRPTVSCMGLVDHSNIYYSAVYIGPFKAHHVDVGRATHQVVLEQLRAPHEQLPCLHMRSC